MSTPRMRTHSAQSTHALALTALQGHKPTSEFLDLLDELDSDTISTDKAVGRLVNKYQNG